MVEVYCATIFLWGQGEKQLRSFVDIINKIHTTLKLTPELSKSSITFLDEAVSIAEGIIKTDIRVKPIDITIMVYHLPSILSALKGKYRQRNTYWREATVRSCYLGNILS